MRVDDQALSPGPDGPELAEDRASGEVPSGSLRLETDAAPDTPATEDELFALVYRQMRSLAIHRRADLDDLVQTAAEAAIRGLPGFEGRAKLSTWTYRICHLTLLKHERWYRRWLRRFSVTDTGELPDAAVDASVPLSLDLRERVVRLRAAVARLSPKRRAVVTLHDLDGMPIDDVARIVDANVLTVRSRLRDGRRDLARLLAADPYFGDEACKTSGIDP